MATYISCNDVFRQASLAPALSVVTFSTVKIAPFPLPLRYTLSRLHEIEATRYRLDSIVQMFIVNTGKDQERKRRLQSRSFSGTPGYETVDEVVRELGQKGGALHRVRARVAPAEQFTSVMGVNPAGIPHCCLHGMTVDVCVVVVILSLPGAPFMSEVQIQAPTMNIHSLSHPTTLWRTK